MKKIQIKKKNNFFKKIFIKLCRIIGFEIIDQSTFSSPSLGKKLNETMSIQGQKSITIPLGEIKIKKKYQISQSNSSYLYFGTNNGSK